MVYIVICFTRCLFFGRGAGLVLRIQAPDPACRVHGVGTIQGFEGLGSKP